MTLQMGSLICDLKQFLWLHIPASHIGGSHPAVYLSVLSHSWAQNQIPRVGVGAQGMS